MAAGSIIIDLLMRTGSFETDSKRSAKALRELKKEAEEAGRAIGLAFGAIALAAGALAKNAVDGLDALKDLSDVTGASVENLSALESIMRRNGGALEDVESLLIKFNAALKDADGKDNVSQILKSIGLDAEKLKKLDPAEALLQVARAFDTYGGKGDKARLVQELFGKQVRIAGPFLKDLAEAGRLNATATTAQAEAAEEFKKQLAGVTTNTQEAARAIVGDLLPALNALLRDVAEGSVADKIFGTLGLGTSTAAEALVVKLNKVNEAIATTQKQINDVSNRKGLLDVFTTEGGVATGLEALRRLGDGDLPTLQKRMAELRGESAALERAMTSLAKVSDRSVPGAPDRPKPPPPPPPRRGRVKEFKSAGEQDAHVKAFLEDIKRLDEAAADAAQAQEAFFQTQQRNLQAFEEEAAAAKELAATFGLTRDELYSLDQEKLRAQALALETLATQKEEKSGNEELARLYRQQAAAIRQTADARDLLNQKQVRLRDDPLTGASQAVKDYLNDISRAGDETRRITEDALHGLEDVLASDDPRRAAKKLVSGVLDEFYRLLVIKPLMQSITGGAGGGGGGGLAALLALLGGGRSSGPAIPSSSVSPFPQFETGTPYVPKTGLALVHEGERIIPASQNRGGVNVSVHNGPAGWDYEGSQMSDGTIVMVAKRVARAELVRASRPGGLIKQTQRRQAPDRR